MPGNRRDGLGRRAHQPRPPGDGARSVLPLPSPGRTHQRRAGGWYGYGFPVETYRWGWFGVEHYYPTVLWHKGYNGDTVRWAYRQGF